MGKSATIFKDIGKACNDLLTKDFKVGKTTVEVKSNTPSGVTLTPLATKSGDKVSGELKAKYAFTPALTGEMVFGTSGSVTGNIEMADALTSGLTLTAECERAAPGKQALLGSANLIAEFKQEAFTTKLSYDHYKNDVLANATFALGDITLGSSVDYCTRLGAVQKYAAVGQYVHPDFTATVKCNDAKGAKTMTATYMHKVSADMLLGVSLAKPLTTPDVGIEFGCSYKLDKDTTVKGKVDSDGILYTSYKQQLSPLTCMTLCAQVDTVNRSDNKHKFRLALNITP